MRINAYLCALIAQPLRNDWAIIEARNCPIIGHRLAKKGIAHSIAQSIRIDCALMRIIA